MANGVLVTRDSSGYGSVHALRVAGTSVNTAYQCIDDEVLLYRPRDITPGSYIGTAKVTDVWARRGKHHILIELEDILLFNEPLGLSPDGRYLDQSIVDATGNLVFQATAPGLHLISRSDFSAIVRRAGVHFFSHPSQPAFDPEMHLESGGSLLPPLAVRATRSVLVRSPLRNRCLDVYGWRCMFSGRNLDLPHGASLLEASHFHPLRFRGLDELSNIGIKTPILHKLWEYGYFALRADGTILFAPDFPDLYRAEFNGRTEAEFPRYRKHRPNPSYLEFHRTELYEKQIQNRMTGGGRQ
ncbi:hypothetical protein SAMN05216456_3669 [Devosia crocina]|uniref:HNH endonuclease n=1 Tax=Devosia crocina TaxID=429728 RepID=A0A1I7NWB4_9HYPH|nr:hypothetical protein [Devosia crocina]SFV38939.1 hypothetical protein SAMN05216456_3669 [Devosia crocina]